MVSKSSISVQSLGKIALRAGCRCENMVFAICCLSQKPARCDAFEGIIIRRGIVALFIGRFGFCFHIYFRRDCLFSCTIECPFPSPVEATIFQKLTETFLRTTSCRQLRDLKKYNRNTLQPGTLMCTYTFFFRGALAEFVKIRTGSAKMAQKEQVCAQKKVIQKVCHNIFVLLCTRGMQLYTHIAVFMCGIRWRLSRAEFRIANFRQFCNTLSKDSFANYGSIWTPFPPSVRGVLYNALNALQFHQVTVQHSQSCSGNFTKRKNWPQCLRQIFPMFIIEIAINSARDRLTLYPAGTHCPRWRDDAFGFQFVLK